MFFLVALLVSVAVVDASTGTVVVASGNSLKVHSSPSTSSPTLYQLPNGFVMTITCYSTGDTISGSQGSTNYWDKISSNTHGGVGYVSQAYVQTSGSIASCSTSGSSGCSTSTGTVVVSSGNTLKVHSSPSTSSSTIYSLQKDAVVGVACVTNGDYVSGGSQGSTSDWYKMSSSKGGYASAAYMSTSCKPSACDDTHTDPTNSTFQAALDYGMRNLGTIYTGCAGGQYRFGVVAPSDMYHDGRTCGQSRNYFQPKGTVGFDCSGLMVEMFDAAGIYLPYASSSSIKDNVPQVSKSQMKNGDMLAKYGHVCMFIGNGQIIESTPFQQNGDTSWVGTRVNWDTSYMNSADYTAHRWPTPGGLN